MLPQHIQRQAFCLAIQGLFFHWLFPGSIVCSIFTVYCLWNPNDCIRYHPDFPTWFILDAHLINILVYVIKNESLFYLFSNMQHKISVILRWWVLVSVFFFSVFGSLCYDVMVFNCGEIQSWEQISVPVNKIFIVLLLIQMRNICLLFHYILWTSHSNISWFKDVDLLSLVSIKINKYYYCCCFLLVNC